jgi:hemophore-related protein
MIMNLSGVTARRRLSGVAAGCLLGGLAAATIAAPTASAAPDCSPGGLANTVSSVTGSARQYLNDHPGANQVVTSAITEPRPQAQADVRTYFTAHPQEYYDLRGILGPIGDTQHQCNVTVLPPDQASAYDEFMAG